ncbi:ATP-binding protein [Kitasatospora sp. MMS16-BH015]|uniref:nSTAND1 domain-containing NTPase n=1 Tax=Kitasatospora sp. MMS16-BH015 TaxID=2018025 RepID=UPI000CF2832C|nr:ATP-binding protein [Kitasatospora sp. MMS16-BH015]
MPRRETPLAPGDAPLLRFAADLRALRERAGTPPYRQLAVRAHCSAASLSVAAGGRRLPSLAVTLAYVQACGGDVAEWQERWQLLAAELAAERASRAQDFGRAPYPGPAAFELADAARFFGREALTDRLAALVAARRLVVVTGSSGAGKSSLVRAGLLARLAADPAPRAYALLTPGDRPMEACAPVLDRLARRARELGDAEPVLVVDQAEELVTRCRDAGERRRFLDAIAAVTGWADPEAGDGAVDGLRCRVVLVVRADQERLIAVHQALAVASRGARVTVGRPAPEELRRAIAEPALRAGCTVEGALHAVLIAAGAQQPGALPLLSAALLETWRRRSGNALTLAGFQATGGFEGALARTAESLFGEFSAEDRARARAVFLRLSWTPEGPDPVTAPPGRIGSPRPDHGRPVPIAEGVAVRPQAAVGRVEFEEAGVPELLERLTRARLVVLDRDTVELAHHGLPTAWPRLRAWLADGRPEQGEDRRLTEAARRWLAAGRDPELLYRGARLELVRRRVRAEELSPGSVERAFLMAAVRAAEADRRRARRQSLAVATLAAAGGALLTLAGGHTVRRALRG